MLQTGSRSTSRTNNKTQILLTCRVQSVNWPARCASTGHSSDPGLEQGLSWDESVLVICLSHQEARLTVVAYCRRRDLMSPSYIRLSQRL